MRLRRLELVIIVLTIAFACFMGGFFTGRSWNAVNIVAVASQTEDSQSLGTSISLTGSNEQESRPTPEENAVDTGSPAQPGGNAEKTSGGTGAQTPPEAPGAPKGGDGRININLATQSELMDLPGIGNVLASRIVDYRRQHGDFSRIEDIRNVSGIGEKRYEAIQDKIMV